VGKSNNAAGVHFVLDMFSYVDYIHVMRTQIRDSRPGNIMMIYFKIQNLLWTLAALVAAGMSNLKSYGEELYAGVTQGDTMKLYYAPGACSLAPHIALNELGVAHSAEKVDLRAKKTETGGDFLGINGKGYVPTLETGADGTLTEVSVILQYLADHNPAKGLLPKLGDMGRYRAMEMLNFISAELHKGIGGLFNPAMPDAGKDAIKARVDVRLNWFDKQLASKPFALGEAFSVADAYAFTVLRWCKNVGIDLAKFASITAYMDRIAARPAVQKTLQAEGLA
jgi:glutathione S-transferase